MDLARAIPDATDLEAELVRHYPALHRRLTIVLGDSDDGQDIAQAAMADALTHRNRFTGGDARAWLYTIGLRLAFNELRRRRRAASRTAGEEPTWAMKADPDLWLAMRALEPQHRAALLLSTLEGYTHAEIGAILGVAEGTVSSWLSRTKDRLRRVLAEEAHD
jgi:RNA polymerase sigma-70 factor, ECF subfamily